METRDEQFANIITATKDRIHAKYYASFINSTSIEERELIHAKTIVLNDVIFAIINETKRNNK